MKYLKLTLLVMAIALLGGMKNANAQLVREWFTANNDAVTTTRMQLDGAGNIYALQAAGSAPFELIKYDSTGNIIWSVNYALAVNGNQNDKMIVDGGGNA